MLDSGVVISTRPGGATVRVQRHAACAQCGLCHRLAHGSREMLLEARDPIGAQPGDLVRVKVPEVGVVKASFWAYGVPTLGGSLGGILGWYASAALGFASETGVGLGAGAGLVAAYRLVMAYDRRLRSRWRGPEVVEILAREGEAQDVRPS